MWWGNGSFGGGYGSEGDYQDNKESLCSHKWEEKILFNFTYFECSWCNCTKKFEEMKSSDTIAKRISDLPLRQD